MRVEEVSIGDYVLPGGEPAAIVMIEAVLRLMAGVLGNPASHREDSHSPVLDGLLEGPSYTRPPSWRRPSPSSARCATPWNRPTSRANTARSCHVALCPDVVPHCW